MLKILRLLCRRSLLTADVSSAAFYRACGRLIPTLLIDETATAGTSRICYISCGLETQGRSSHCFPLPQQSNREPLLPDLAAVLGTHYRVIHLQKQDAYPIGNPTGEVNAGLKESGESRRLPARGVGAALASLGITTRTRMNQGWLVWINRDWQKGIHDLVVLHGLDTEYFLPNRIICERCALCDPDKNLRNYRFGPN